MYILLSTFLCNVDETLIPTSSPPDKDDKRINPIQRLFLATIMNAFRLVSYLSSSPEQRRVICLPKVKFSFSIVWNPS